MLSQDDRVNIVILMAKHDCSPVTVQRVWRKEYGTNPPSDNTIRQTYKRFRETGSIHDLKREGRPRISDEKVETIREQFEQHANSSLRQASRELDIPYETLRQNLKDTIGMRCFHYTVVHELLPDDHFARREYAELMKQRINNDNILDHLCFSDEAKFCLNSVVNRHNCIIWGYSNPKSCMVKPLKSEGITVWAAMFRDKLVGPYFFESTVNQEAYLSMLKDFFIPLLKQWRRLRNTHFQQDGAPPHWGLRVREFLNQNFGDKWIGRSGPTAWPPRSPDLTPMDFYLWGDIKEKVFKRQPKNIDDLKTFIREEFSKITGETLTKVFDDMVSRLSLCIEANGGQFQHL